MPCDLRSLTLGPRGTHYCGRARATRPSSKKCRANGLASRVRRRECCGPAVASAVAGGRDSVFDLEQFVSDCRALVRQEHAQPAVREVVARAVSEPSSVIRALGEPTRGGIYVLYQSTELTVLNLVWAPLMTLL